jgi:hypothetical protein
MAAEPESLSTKKGGKSPAAKISFGEGSASRRTGKYI